MDGMLKPWTGRNRAITVQGVVYWILAKLLHLCVLVMFGFLWVYPPVQLAPVIVVPGDFPSIQGAVNAAVPGTTIKVRSGIYTEQIVISKDLILVGDGVGKTIIQAPSTLTPYAEVVKPQFPLVAVVRITDGAKVTLSGLTVTGPVPCGVAAQGIGVVKAAILEIKEFHTGLYQIK